jgi:hypothetical protein
MHQPYPTDAQMPEVRPPSVPPSITYAVRIMYAGAVISVVGIVIDALTVNATKSAIEKKSPHLSASQLNTDQHSLVTAFVIWGVIATALWILIAVKCRAGKSGARLTGTILFAIATIDLLGAAIAPEPGLVKIWSVVTWLAGLAAVILLWRSSSTDFFQGLT